MLLDIGPTITSAELSGTGLGIFSLCAPKSFKGECIQQFDTALIFVSVSWVHLHGPVIQANGRLIFGDDLRSGGLLCFISMNASVRTELADSMVTPGEPGGD